MGTADCEPEPDLPTFHRFLDETGDDTFFGKGRVPIIGKDGVSLGFGIGVAKIDRPLAEVRAEIEALQTKVEEDGLLSSIPSVQKRVERGGFFFHACKDTPDVRTELLHYLKDLPCEAEVVMARKDVSRFDRQHGGRADEFYADLLSHLIKQRLKRPGTLVLNVAERGSSTREKVLQHALDIAIQRAGKKWKSEEIKTRVVFNVQTPRTEPLLAVADYLCWSVQRVFERGETRYHDYLQSKIRLVVDLYDTDGYEGNKNYYDHRRNPLTAANKLSPPDA